MALKIVYLITYSGLLDSDVTLDRL